MARSIANVVIATDSFASWVGITNQMADTFTNYALTANSSVTGATVTGNSQLIGIFASNTVAVGTSLRGGSVNVSSNLNVTSNLIVTGATVNIASNVALLTTNVYVNAATTYITGGLANATSNVSITNTNTYINAAVTYVTGGLADVTSNVSVVNTNTYINAAVTYVTGGLANVTSNVSIQSANVYINATAFGVASISTLTGTTTLKANTTLTNFVLSSNATVSNLQISVNNLNITATANVSGNLSVSAFNSVGNAVVNGAFTVNNTAAVGNTTITGFANVTTTLQVSGNTTLNSTLLANNITANGTTTLANTNVNGLTLFANDVALAVISNTNIGNANTLGTFNAVEVASFPIASYTGAKITAKISALGGANNQVQELIVAQNTTDVYMTVYGTVAAPATANLGVFSASINTTAVSIKFLQTGANTSVKMFAQYIK